MYCYVDLSCNRTAVYQQFHRTITYMVVTLQKVKSDYHAECYHEIAMNLIPIDLTNALGKGKGDRRGSKSGGASRPKNDCSEILDFSCRTPLEELLRVKVRKEF